MSPEPLILVDWRDATPLEMRTLYTIEHDHWRRELAWETTTAWREVEESRVAARVYGFLARDPRGTVRGWAYLLADGETAHLGGMVSQTPEVSRLLLDACLGAVERHMHARRVLCFLPVRAIGLQSALNDRHFSCERYDYLHHRVAYAEPADHAAPLLQTDRWEDLDVQRSAVLLRDAYSGRGRHFAPQETLDEWERYVRNLVDRSGCGLLVPELTRLCRAGHAIDALVLVTSIGPRTLHLAQVVVHPSKQRRGLARALVKAVLARSADHGYQLATLLVGEHNTAARRLYDDLGFTERSTFLAAVRDM